MHSRIRLQYLFAGVFLVAFPSIEFGQTCLPCHKKQVEGYAKSAMARSMSASAAQPSSRFLHEFSGTAFSIETSKDGKMTQHMTRDGLRVDYPIAYTVGSGDHAFGYLVKVNDRLFQSPISYYGRRQIWDMAPGFEKDPAPEFDRPVVPECLECHAGSLRPVRNTLNRYEDPPFSQLSISCDRCHGDATAHVRKPSRANIVNPVTLPPRSRDSVCEQCHLSGEVRILNPRREFSDFHAGQELETVFSVYLQSENKSPSPASSIKVVSHVEQLALSLCMRRSGTRMWCGSCHDPHEKPVIARQYFRKRCLACHGESLLRTHPKLPGTDETKTSTAGGESEAGLADCIGCHMPKRPAKDGGHTAFTDHRITRSAAADRTKQDTSTAPGEIVAWRDPAGSLALRNLGLANVHVGERYHSASHMEKGAELLASAMKLLPEDAVIVTNLGVVLLRQGMASAALDFFQFATQMEPAQAGYHVNLAAAYKEIGSVDQAILELERSLTIDKSLGAAYHALINIFGQSNEAALRRTLQRYLAIAPGDIKTRVALRQLNTSQKYLKF